MVCWELIGRRSDEQRLYSMACGADPLVRAGRPRPACAGRRGRRPRTRGSAPQLRVCPAGEGLKGVEVSTVVARIIDGGFEDERLRPELGVAEDSSECFASDVAFADIRVTVDARATRGF